MSQPKQQQPAQPPAIAGNGSVDPTDPNAQVARKQPKPIAHMEPTTYIDPTADVVLRPRDGRNFRVQSWMLKANW